MEKVDKPLNEIIQIYRIIATIIVCYLHFQIAFCMKPIRGGQGYIMVDFFAILSGFLIAKHYHSAPKKHYLLKRFLNLYFIYIIPIIILAVFNCVIGNRSIKRSIIYFMSHILEFCMGDWIIPNNPNSIVPVLWYIPALFFSTFIIWNILSLYHEAFERIFSVIIALIIYNYFYVAKGHVDAWPLNSEFYLNDGLLRVIAGTFLGVFCHFIVERLLLLSCNMTQKKLIGLCSCLSQFILFILIITDKWGLIMGDFSGGNDFVYIFLLAVNISIAFWSELYIGKNKLIDFLSKICYPAYTLHFVICTIMNYFSDGSLKIFSLGIIFITILLISSFFLEKAAVNLTKNSMRILNNL